jgi:hypothetical protein
MRSWSGVKVVTTDDVAILLLLLDASLVSSKARASAEPARVAD